MHILELIRHHSHLLHKSGTFLAFLFCEMHDAAMLIGAVGPRSVDECCARITEAAFTAVIALADTGNSSDARTVALMILPITPLAGSWDAYRRRYAQKCRLLR